MALTPVRTTPHFGTPETLPRNPRRVAPRLTAGVCIVHPTRASLRWVNYKDRKRVAAQLKLIYGAATEQAARDALDAWTDSEVGRQYPAIKRAPHGSA